MIAPYWHRITIGEGVTFGVTPCDCSLLSFHNYGEGCYVWRNTLSSLLTAISSLQNAYKCNHLCRVSDVLCQTTTTFSSKARCLSMIRNQRIWGLSGSCGSSQAPQPPMCIFSWSASLVVSNVFINLTAGCCSGIGCRSPDIHSTRVYVPRMGTRAHALGG